MDMVEEVFFYFHHTQGYRRLCIAFYENHLYNISIKTKYMIISVSGGKAVYRQVSNSLFG
jgi:hypothetical protein